MTIIKRLEDESSPERFDYGNCLNNRKEGVVDK